jgi:hypothetical protein
MLDRIAAAEVLQGVRGAEPADADALADVISAGCPELVDETSRRSASSTSTRCSPRPDGASAADVRILLRDRRAHRAGAALPRRRSSRR